MRKKKTAGEPVLHFGAYPAEINGKLTFVGAMQLFLDFIRSRWNEKTCEVYYKEYEERIFPLIKDAALEELSEDDFEAVISSIKKSAMKKSKPLSDARIAHFRHLIRQVTRAAAANGVCGDVLWGSAFSASDDEPAEQRGAVKSKLRKSMAPKEERAFYSKVQENPEEDGELIGLAIMFTLGLRNSECCALNFEHISSRADKEAFPVLNVMSSTIGGSSERKLGGKTPNAPRTLPIPDSLYKLLRARREIVERKIAAGEIATPIEQLPIVCRGNNYTERCKSGDLTVAGKKVFQEIKLDENVVADVAFELGQRFAEEDYTEKDVTSYFLRRNFATHIAILGCTQDEAHYLMGHAIFSRENEKSVMINPKTLNRLKRMLEKRPIVGSSANGKKQAIKLVARKNNQDDTDSGLVGKIEAQEVHIIGNVIARETEELRLTVSVKEPKTATIFLSTIPAEITQSDSSVSVLETYYKMYGIKE